MKSKEMNIFIVIWGMGRSCYLVRHHPERANKIGIIALNHKEVKKKFLKLLRRVYGTKLVNQMINNNRLAYRIRLAPRKKIKHQIVFQIDSLEIIT